MILTTTPAVEGKSISASARGFKGVWIESAKRGALGLQYPSAHQTEDD